MSGANRSTAVMQQRRPDGAERRRGRVIAPPALNYFPTPPWATRALCQFLADPGHRPAPADVLGTGVRRRPHGAGRCANISRTFGPATFTSTATTTSPTSPWRRWSPTKSAASTGSSPTRRSPSRSTSSAPPPPPVARGFAMLVRGAFLEGADRHAAVVGLSAGLCAALRRTRRDARRALGPGRRARPVRRSPGTKASSATAYVWLVWLAGQFDTRTAGWAHAASAGTPGDYPDYSAELPAAAPEGLFA
jgi:hypothetical protein